MTDAQPRTPTLTRQEQRVRRAHLVACCALLAVLAVGYLAVAALVASDLPAQVPVHFGVDGVADGWLDRGIALVAFGLVGLGLPVLLLVIFAAGEWWRGSSARFVTALVCGVAVGLVAMFAWLLWSAAGGAGLDALRSGPDAGEVRMSPWLLLGPLAVAVGVGLVVAALLPPPLPQPIPERVEPLAISPSDRVSWFGRARSAQSVLLALLAAVMLVVLAFLATGVWWLWLVAVLLLLLFPATTVFTVTVDRGGLTWRSALGVPRGHVPLEDVTQVSVVQVRPGDYGGYGVRSVPGATAIVTRHGSALQVEREAGRTFIITVDDATAAASVLEGLRLRG